MINKLTRQLYIDMLMTGACNLKRNKQEVNRINVFPLADQDTGENMYLTITQGLAGITLDEADFNEVLKKISGHMVYYAQGNSGIILAKMFSEFANGLLNDESSDEKDLALIKKSYSYSAAEAYKAVANPVEGTMLTAYRVAIEKANEESNDESLESYFNCLYSNLINETKNTKDQLKILKENNVIDSGALGLQYIFEGFINALSGKVERIDLAELSELGNNEIMDINFDELEAGFYCTNFLLNLDKYDKKLELKKELEEIGSSLVFFESEGMIKGHIHTAFPNNVKSKIGEYGDVVRFSIDKMGDEKSYTLFGDTNCDLTPDICKKHHIKLISYPYTVDGKIIYPYIDFEEFDYKEFYGLMRKGVKMTTFALSKEQYVEYFEPEFQRGKDILYVHQSEATTGSFKFMREAVRELQEKYPNRRFAEIDTKAFTILGLNIVLRASDLYNEGKTIDEMLEWAETEVDNFALLMTAKDLSFFERSGRITHAQSGLGNLIGLHPILDTSRAGIIDQISKCIGIRKTLKKIINMGVEDQIEADRYRIIIAHSDFDFGMNYFRKNIKKYFPNAEILEGVLNPTIGVHSGPGCTGFTFHGRRRS